MGVKTTKSDILLFSADDVNRVRKKLVEEQGGVDPITKEPLVSPCLDHLHDNSQQVRAAISREINVLVGKIENTYMRNIKYWCDVPLAEILRGVADYLEQEPLPIIHPGWKKKAQTAFNKLNAKGQDAVLQSFGYEVTIKPNLAKRKSAFAKLLASRTVTYGEVLDEIKGTRK